MPAKDKINLLPKDDFDASLVGKLVKWAVDVGRWIVVLTEFVVICAFLSRFYFDTKLANLFDEVKQKQAIVDSALTFEENFRLVQEKTKIIKDLLAEEKTPSVLITEIGQLLPFDVSLTKITVGQEKMSIAGYSLSDKSLNVFLRGLVLSQKFQEVSLDSIASREDNAPGVTFTASAVIKK